MCSIFGSFDKDILQELYKINAHRGEFSHSVSTFDDDTVTIIRQGLGPVHDFKFDLYEDDYCIMHLQAPTTENDGTYIHPAEERGYLLWHNGILKPETIARLGKELGNESPWDSKLLLSYMIENTAPKNIDGSFSCLYYNIDYKALYLFRNEIAPMFIDHKFNISSTPFINSIATDANKVLLFRPHEKELTTIATFKTINNPYSF